MKHFARLHWQAAYIGVAAVTSILLLGLAVLDRL